MSEQASSWMVAADARGEVREAESSGTTGAVRRP
jgi:hypothetical protein